MLLFLKLNYFKLAVNVILMGHGDTNMYIRTDSFFKAMAIFGPIVFVCEILDLWFIENQSFTLFTAGFVVANAIIGGITHKIKGDFRFETFFIQTFKMTGIITLTYLVLEGIVSPIGDNSLTSGIIAVFQVATLLYPGSKILKNIFIWSDGEHPPKWIMEKVYNFKENGDLKAFLGSTDKTDFPIKQDEDEFTN